MTNAHDTVIPAKNAKLIYGVGYNSKGRYKAFINGAKVKAYDVWRDMLRRCYCPKNQSVNASYINCSVDERWHDFQDFAEWYNHHEYAKLDYQLDKDILFTGNKLYSAETCCFVPQELNKMLTNSKAARGEYPQGVHFRKDNGKFRAYMSMNGKRKNLGQFDCPNKAYQAHKAAKESYVKEKALEWQDRIAPEVFQALMNWQLTE